jgi:hypothetical protein
MSTEAKWRTLIGAVQFDPTPRDVNGKEVLAVTIRTTGGKDDQSKNVSCTLWPSHAHLFDTIEKGDVLAVEGKYQVNKGTKDGEAVFYHNLSVTGILKLGALDKGQEVETTESDETEPDEDAAW